MHLDALTCFSNFLFLMYSSNGVVLLATNNNNKRESTACEFNFILTFF